MKMISKLEYTEYCLYEALRISAPYIQQSSIKLNENLEIDGITLHKDSIITFDHHFCQRREEAWYFPEKYIPERFDPQHKYFKTPAGNKRHQLDF